MVHMSIRHTANNAIIVLNKYYSRTDECVMYRVAMSKSFTIIQMFLLMQQLVMHPRYKTRYFTKECWPEEWIDEAISLAREIWIAHSRDSRPSSPPSTIIGQASNRG